MARWVANQGARNLVLVSRSGSTSSKIQDLIDELSKIGVNVIVKKCDVSNSDSVNNLISKEIIGMPEIRGVIHGAMVLKVTIHPPSFFEELLIRSGCFI